MQVTRFNLFKSFRMVDPVSYDELYDDIFRIIFGSLVVECIKWFFHISRLFKARPEPFGYRGHFIHQKIMKR